MAKKINKTDAILTVLQDGIRDVDEGIRLVQSITGDNYSEDAIENSINGIIKGLKKTDLGLSKGILKYRLVEKNGQISITEYDKETKKEIFEAKKEHAKKVKERKKQKEKSIYFDEEEIKAQTELINEILIIRNAINYWAPGSQQEEIDKLKLYPIDVLENHKNCLIKKNPSLKSKILESLKS